MLLTALEMWLFFAIIINLKLLYAHRSVSHSQVKFRPGMIILVHISVWLVNNKYSATWAKTWAAVHLEHHKYADLESDPHSPHHKTLGDLINGRRHWYTQSEINKITANLDAPTFKIDQWLEKYRVGPWVSLAICLLLFHWWGILLWIACCSQRFLFGVFNYICHKGLGYNNIANSKTHDQSRNIPYIPFMFVYLGEELHGNHHRCRSRANFAVKWWEIDLGYWFLKLLSIFGLVSIVSKPQTTLNLKFKLER